MRKIKLTDILLLSVAGMLDIFQEMKDPGKIYSNYYENFYGFVPDRWKRQNYYSLVSKLITDRKIKRIKKNGTFKYQITPKGTTLLQKRWFLHRLQDRKWDKKWRILIFDIEEVNKVVRNSLRNIIKEFGFGYLQKSVWISPYDIFQQLEKYIEIYKIKDKVVLIESKKLSIPNYELASIVWQINIFKLRYEEIYKKLSNISKQIKTNKNNNRLKLDFNKTYKLLIKIILQDPHLPKEFLPNDWPYDTTVKLAKKLRGIFLR